MLENGNESMQSDLPIKEETVDGFVETTVQTPFGDINFTSGTTQTPEEIEVDRIGRLKNTLEPIITKDNLTVESVPEQDSVEVTTEDGIVIEEENKTIEPIEYAKARLLDDGYLGIPQFTEDELHILAHNMYIDISSIDVHKEMMKNALSIINNLKGPELVDSPDNDIQSSIDLYNASRNILLQYLISIDEYIGFIDENKDEMLKDVKDGIDKAIQLYVKKSSEEFGIEYKEGTLVNYLCVIGLKRAIKNIDTDCLATITNLEFVNDYDINFEKELQRTVSSISLLISNGHRTNDDRNIGKDENEILRISTNIIKKFKKITKYEQDDDVFKAIGGTPKTLFMNFMFKISKLMGKNCYFDLKEERTRYTTKQKRYRKKGYTNPLPLHDEFIKKRIVYTVVEHYIKKWFSLSLFGTSVILDDKDKFLSIIEELDTKFTTSEVFVAIINTLSFRFVFDELMNIIENVREATGNDSLTIQQIKMFKNYLMFVSYYRNSLSYTDYNAKDVYSDYVKSLLKTIVKKRLHIS